MNIQAHEQLTNHIWEIEGVPNSVEGLRRRSVCGSPYATSSRVSKRGSSRTAFRIHRSR